MLAYVNLIQRREKEHGVDVLTHQKWSGAAYVDGILGAIQSGSSGSKSMGEGNTETGITIHLSTRSVFHADHLCPQASSCEKLISDVLTKQPRLPGFSPINSAICSVPTLKSSRLHKSRPNPYWDTFKAFNTSAYSKYLSHRLPLCIDRAAQSP